MYKLNRNNAFIILAISIAFLACKKQENSSQEQLINENSKIKGDWSLSKTTYTRFDKSGSIVSTHNEEPINEEKSTLGFINQLFKVGDRTVDYEITNKGADTILKYSIYNTEHEFKLSKQNNEIITLEQTLETSEAKSTTLLLFKKIIL